MSSTTNSEKQRGGQFATFHVADLFFGIPVLDVQEVMRAQEMTPVPRAPIEVEGLINLRGQIVTALDMRRRMRIPAVAGDAAAPMNIVVRSEDGIVSLLVDEIGDVVEADPDSFEPVPPTVPAHCLDVIDGVYKMDHRLMLVLNTARALEPSQA
jgi:purine-binding chemotaxis protein CheW